MLALRMGWTLDYIRGMDADDYERVVTVIGQYDMVQKHAGIRVSERMKG